MATQWTSKDEAPKARKELSFLMNRKEDGAAFAAGTLADLSVIRMKPTKAAARAEVTRTGAKPVVAGFSTISEEGPVVLFMNKGAFARAKRLFTAWLKLCGRSKRVILGGHLEEEAEPEGPLVLDPVLAAEFEEDAAEAPAAEEAPADDAPSEGSTEATTQAAVLTDIARSVLSRIRRANSFDADAFEAATRDRLAALTERSDPDTMKNAAARLLLEVGQTALLGPSNRDVLTDRPADQPVTTAEVVDHFRDLGTEVLKRAGRTAVVSRAKIEERVASLFGGATHADERLALVDRLSRTLLPVLSDPDRIAQYFVDSAPHPVQAVWTTCLAEARTDFDDLKSTVNGHLARLDSPLRIEDLGHGWSRVDALLAQVAASDLARHLDRIGAEGLTPDTRRDALASLASCRAALQEHTITDAVPFGKGAYVTPVLERGLAKIEATLAA
ncbi:hypothetical protein [Falsirhodobacter sp. 20TX0035]|uniref:hypothetical protein n=1 Tax=Falsirhodobacter sp. 20TX0035 TaxID=3022019 RepID=UPI002330F3BB|nr:hypothetical protein [Falsirhodobacter sp. 20TX0035]MDB6454050.1 hypothetical protein [Falsirhodobacter sp. 20TX0035]